MSQSLLNRALAPIVGRIRAMVARGTVAMVDDAPMAQEMQVELLDGEAHGRVERLQDYGLSSVPLEGAEVVVAAIGGTRSHLVALRTEDRRYRPQALQPGEVVLYDDLGNRISLLRGRIEIAAVTELKIVAPAVIVEADSIELGAAGGAKVARVGDRVDLSTGRIIEGSDTVRAS